MKYGFCPICGAYDKLLEPGEQPPPPRSVFNPYCGDYHKCAPKWLCTFGEEGEHDDHPIYAPSARQAAEKYAQWYDRQYMADMFSEGEDAVATVTDVSGTKYLFDVESEVVREYHAREKPEAGKVFPEMKAYAAVGVQLMGGEQICNGVDICNDAGCLHRLPHPRSGPCYVNCGRDRHHCIDYETYKKAKEQDASHNVETAGPD